MWRSNKALHCWPMWTRTSRLQQPSNAKLAAVDGGVADVLALDEVDDVLGDVGGVVADALEIFGDEDQFEGGKDDAGIAHHVAEQFTENLIAVVVHLIVGGEDSLGELHIAADDGVEGVANHLLGELAHAREIDVGLHAGVAKDAQGALGDVDSLIADALEIVVDAGDSQRESEVDGHELVQGKKLNDAIVDFHLELVDGVFFLEDAIGELFIGIQNGVNGLVNGAFRQAAHPEQPFFHLVDVFLKVAFHGVLSSESSRSSLARILQRRPGDAFMRPEKRQQAAALQSRRSFNSFRSFSKWRSMKAFP